MRGSILGLGFLAFALVLPLAAETPAGVVVESVAPHYPGAAAGFQPGDVILSSSGGSIVSPYDLLPLETEEAPRHGVTLRGRRGGEERTWTLNAADWKIAARPGLPSDLAALYFAGKAGAEAGDLAVAERSWRSAARSTEDCRLAAWFLERLAGELADIRKWTGADAAYQEALALLERESDRPAMSHLLHDWGWTFEVRGDGDAALEHYRKALEIERAAAPRSLAVARILGVLGPFMAKRGDYAASEDLLKQALAIQEELAPGSLEVAKGFNKLGVLARWRGDLAAAEGYLTRSAEIRQRLAPGSADHGLTLLNLSNVAFQSGDLKKAENLSRQALAILETVGPDGSAHLGSLQALVNIAIQSGNLTAADDLLRRILTVQERRGFSEWEAWSTLLNLGNVAKERGDLEAAEVHYRRALEIQESRSPGSREVSTSLGSLGELALLKGDFAAARGYLQRAREIEEKRAPGSIDTAASLKDLARLELEGGGDLAMAEGLLRRALAIFEKEAPESLEGSLVLRLLGEVAARRGRLEESLSLHRRSFDLQSRVIPGSIEEAEALYYLGRAERRAGRSQEGIRNLCRSIDVLDRQRTRLGGTPEARISFEATLGDHYHACLEGLVELGRSAEAFHVLERGRARSFLALLAERDLRFSDLPPELAAERSRVNAEYDRVWSQLVPLSAGRDDAEIARLTGELHDLRTRQEEIVARMRRESPRSAALHHPEPLDLAGARAALDPGTLLLEYAVGQEKTWLFVVEPREAEGSGIAVFPIATGAKGLSDEVEGFRLLLKDPGSNLTELRTRARRLYDLLILPAEARIDGARRLLLSPDGPLHTLAFAALMRGDRYLVEWKPIHTVLSATVYAELARSRPSGRDLGESRLAAFGDPVYRPLKPDAPVDPEVREAVRRGLDLVPLPFSGREVKAIAGLFPQAQVYLGRDATEEKAKSVGPQARLVHFACHGILDERFPLNSALALTLPEQRTEGRDNGLLQAWEIFESVRLDADLVTLSACDTALGKEMGGEGLVGLTRAFQYAGARSVLASLWGVADSSTSRLMQRFYGHLRSGKPKDEALRAAQMDRIRDSHPFHWAAFQLTGDWR